jgi:hypothetical protein
VKKTFKVYLEGGGDSAEQKAQLRKGMDAFLREIKDKVQEKKHRWQLSPCGGRKSAYDAFMAEWKHKTPGEVIILLVDSEEPVTTATRAAHLKQRQGDGWDLAGVPESHIQLMIQSMEAWIVADPEALAVYYGQHFNKRALPTRQNLEEEPKVDCLDKLISATKKALPKGEYQKIAHASDLLQKISPGKVRSRCPTAQTLFDEIMGLI